MRVIFFLIMFGISCQNKTKSKHLRSDVVKSGYFCEHFKIDSYGVGGDVYSLYLTDSINFREFVCNYYDNLLLFVGLITLGTFYWILIAWIQTRSV